MVHEAADGTWARFGRTTRTVSVVAFWYAVSASVILTTKLLLSRQDGVDVSWHYFPFPLTIAAFANTAVTIWALLVSFIPSFSDDQSITMAQFRRYVLPIGASTAAEIGFSNSALLLLTVSFGTILKGSSPVFTMVWGVLLAVERFSVPLFLSVLVIAGGIVLASIGEGSSFSVLGLVLQLSAIALGGFRWAMTQKLLKGSPSNLMSPNTAILYTSPTTAAFVLPFALMLESGRVYENLLQRNTVDLCRLLVVLSVIATLIYILLISEYWLVHDTSSLALSVAAVFKECMTIAGGLLFFSEKLTLLKVVGFCVCQAGIAFYVALRYNPQEPYAVQPFDMSAEEGVDVALFSSPSHDHTEDEVF